MLPNDVSTETIISVLHAALIVYITECREVNDADGEMYARHAQDWLDAQAQAPQPDWSQAPEWAQWWAVDGSGVRTWFEHEPRRATYGWVKRHGELVKVDGWRDLEIGIDWRTTLQRKPEAHNG